MFAKMLKVYSIKNKNGIVIKVLNYGGIITDIITPDRFGEFKNIVLKYNDMSHYEKNELYLGAIIGRTSGRISMSRFDINGVTYILENNQDTNNLHGGVRGFDKRFWNIDEIENGLRLSLFSEDGDGGFPGNVSVVVDYILNDDNEFHIIYNATTDEPTVLNLTNHTYFNLGEELLNHNLKIISDEVMDFDHILAPTGETIKVKDTAFDFNKSKPIGRDINSDFRPIKQCSGYDHAFILNHDKEYDLELFSEATGRRVRIKTDKEVSVVYTMNQDNKALDDFKKMGVVRGIAIELQSHPDGINHENFESSIITPELPYWQHTIYKFDVYHKNSLINKMI